MRSLLGGWHLANVRGGGLDGGALRVEQRHDDAFHVVTQHPRVMSAAAGEVLVPRIIADVAIAGDVLWIGRRRAKADLAGGRCARAVRECTVLEESVEHAVLGRIEILDAAARRL